MAASSKWHGWCNNGDLGTPLASLASQLPIGLPKTFSELLCSERLFLPSPPFSLFSIIAGPHDSLKALPTYSSSLPFILHRYFPKQIFYTSNSVCLSASQNIYTNTLLSDKKKWVTPWMNFKTTIQIKNIKTHRNKTNLWWENNQNNGYLKGLWMGIDWEGI